MNSGNTTTAITTTNNKKLPKNGAVRDHFPLITEAIYVFGKEKLGVFCWVRGAITPTEHKQAAGASLCSMCVLLFLKMTGNCAGKRACRETKFCCSFRLIQFPLHCKHENIIRVEDFAGDVGYSFSCGVV